MSNPEPEPAGCRAMAAGGDESFTDRPCEGRYQLEAGSLAELEEKGQVVLRYQRNPMARSAMSPRSAPGGQRSGFMPTIFPERSPVIPCWAGNRRAAGC